MRIYSFVWAFVCFIVLFASSSLVWATPQTDSEKNRRESQFTNSQIEFFESKVRPILIERCFECHGPQSSPLEAGLNVSSRGGLIEGGDTGPAIVPGHADQSLFVDAINYGDVYEMPPDTKLSSDEILTLTQWIEDGAAWPAETESNVSNREQFDLESRKSSHWGWQPIVNHTPPEVANHSWPKKPIDYFILKRLEEAGLNPAPAADRRTLIRRAYFDIVGLPPSPKQIQDFVDDPSADAFENVVDELLSSPRFGERWARHWMDLTRYAESYGHQYDYNMAHAFRYRDYLIRAFNEDVSYRQLIHEHVAGDLMPNPRRNHQDDFNESIIGTGFWFLGERKPSAVDSRGSEAEAIDNQIDVMSKAFLGMTVGCARCHDHKFDAISTADYYSLAGFMQSSRRQITMLDPGRKIESSFDAVSKLVQSSDDDLREFAAQVKTGKNEIADSGLLAKYLGAAIGFRKSFPVADSELPSGQSAARKKKKNAARKPTTKSDSVIAAEKEAIHQFATEENLDEKLLDRLIDAISNREVREQSHPLHPVWSVGTMSSDVDRGWAEKIASQAKRDQQKQTDWLKQSVLFADFSDGLPDGWFRTGFAFGDSPASNTVQFSSSGNRFTPPGTIHSGRYGAKFHGVVRSPTFRLDYEQINYLAKGENATIRIIIDGFFMDEFRDLLFAGAKFDIKPTVQFGWQVQAEDLKNHVGSTAHIELIDQGNGYIAVDEIRFSGMSRPVTLSAFSNPRFFEPSQFDSQTRFCELMATGIAEDLSQPSTDEFASTLSWIVKHDLEQLFFGESSRTDDDSLFTQVAAQIGSNQSKIKNLMSKTPSPMLAIGITDGSGEDERVFIRGNHKTLGEVAPRRFLSAVSSRLLNPSDGSGRLQLAHSITSPDNPLTTRVAVNRIWHHMLGQGIVESVDNFGLLGKSPTHPELLDYLAFEFSTRGWSFKQMIKQIALSQAYQMASTPDREAESKDPENQLLHRARIRRLQGEAIRDAMLTVSGRIDLAMYGPSVPIHLTSFMTGRGRPRKSGPLDGAGRRSIYIAVRRNFLSPMMLAFDTPLPANTTGKRNRSNVPAQALILMNSPFVIQQAQRWADQLIEEGEPKLERINSIYFEALGRGPTDLEISQALGFLELQSQELGIPDTEVMGNGELWRDFCHVIFNVKEFIYIN